MFGDRKLFERFIVFGKFCIEFCLSFEDEEYIFDVFDVLFKDDFEGVFVFIFFRGRNFMSVVSVDGCLSIR